MVDRTSGVSSNQSVVDLAPGKLINTSNPFDLMIQGDGLFTVASGNGVFYTRGGQFQKDADGRLVNAQGFALQLQGGSDLTLKGSVPKVLQDGTVLDDGQPVGKLAIAALNDRQAADYAPGGVLSAPAGTVTSVDNPVIRQGGYESSNVSNGDEMIVIMQALRQAEAGQKLVNVYDDMMGRVVDSLGQAGS